MGKKKSKPKWTRKAKPRRYVCKICFNEFAPIRWDAKYCGVQCRKKAVKRRIVIRQADPSLDFE